MPCDLFIQTQYSSLKGPVVTQADVKRYTEKVCMIVHAWPRVTHLSRFCKSLRNLIDTSVRSVLSIEKWIKVDSHSTAQVVKASSALD